MTFGNNAPLCVAHLYASQIALIEHRLHQTFGIPKRRLATSRQRNGQRQGDRLCLAGHLRLHAVTRHPQRRGHGCCERQYADTEQGGKKA
jgi:hypothetical protein